LNSNDLFDIATTAPGPAGELPLTADMLLHSPSGDLFGLSQNAGMGWDPAKVNGRDVLILSTLGGLRDASGKPIALGYHTGHWEVGLLVRECAEELTRLGAIPFAGFVSVRRPHPRHDGYVRLIAVSERRSNCFASADSVTPYSKGGHWSRDLR